MENKSHDQPETAREGLPASASSGCYASDVDADNDAWWDVQAVAARAEQANEDRTHRCPVDMPPCSACEAVIEEEQWKEFGAA